jgi:23S rRNA (guanosine2251-2'-O)-methyltransferase
MRCVEIHHCRNPACDLRFPACGEPNPRRVPGMAASDYVPPTCPRCGAPARVITYSRVEGGRMRDETSSEYPAPGTPSSLQDAPRPPVDAAPAPLCAVLDNLRSAFNVGSIFRVADGAGISRLHLCGYTATPSQKKVAKTALGAEANIDWVYHPNAVKTIAHLQASGWRIVALETTPHARSLYDAAALIPPCVPLALVVGNEVSGIDPEILERADWTLQIPMSGVKESLNVAVAFGVAAYWLQGVRQAIVHWSPR